MAGKKSVVVLDIYTDLLNGRRVNINECMKKYKISVSTFYRYLDDIREYAWDRLFLSVAYDIQEESYKFIKKEGKAVVKIREDK